MLAPCRLYKANDPEVAKQFANMDTVVDGLSIQLHGKCPRSMAQRQASISHC